MARRPAWRALPPGVPSAPGTRHGVGRHGPARQGGASARPRRRCRRDLLTGPRDAGLRLRGVARDDEDVAVDTALDRHGRLEGRARADEKARRRPPRARQGDGRHLLRVRRRNAGSAGQRGLGAAEPERRRGQRHLRRRRVGRRRAAVVVADAGEQHLQGDGAGRRDRHAADHAGRGLGAELQPADRQLRGHARPAHAPHERLDEPRQERGDADQEQGRARCHAHLAPRVAARVDGARERHQQHEPERRQDEPPEQAAPPAEAAPRDAERLDRDALQRDDGDRDGRRRHAARRSARPGTGWDRGRRRRR